MSDSTDKLICPHCEQPLRRFTLPDEVAYDQSVHWACFNDACPYYRRGWEWMWEHYHVRASYRYRVVDPESGWSSPLGVWSETALRDRIIENDTEVNKKDDSAP
ncbi:MAG: hypothetical protein PVF43_06355 [Candidatus Eiseniibacteriota bacterium]|jgi:hypothetical protein